MKDGVSFQARIKKLNRIYVNRIGQDLLKEHKFKIGDVVEVTVKKWER